MMKEIIGVLMVFLIALAVGVAGDYFGVNRYVKYTLMIIAIIFTQKIIRRVT
ncbi:hypothetical protein IZR49_001144 [Salmonella enterica]|nr:hypothetical protein [Salmonella enterica]